MADTDSEGYKHFVREFRDDELKLEALKLAKGLLPEGKSMSTGLYAGNTTIQHASDLIADAELIFKYIKEGYPR